MNRNDLRSLAVEINKAGIKDLIGYSLNSKQPVGSLKLDLEDAIKEIIREGKTDEYYGSLKSSGSITAWWVIMSAFKCNGSSSIAEKESVQVDSENQDELLDLNEVPLQLESPTENSIEEVVSAIKAKKSKKEKKAAKPSETGRAKKGFFWKWIDDRIRNSANYDNPPTRANLLAEMIVLFPACSPHSLNTKIVSVKSWKWTKLDNLIVEDENGLFSIGERRKK